MERHYLTPELSHEGRKVGEVTPSPSACDSIIIRHSCAARLRVFTLEPSSVYEIVEMVYVLSSWIQGAGTLAQRQTGLVCIKKWLVIMFGTSKPGEGPLYAAH